MPPTIKVDDILCIIEILYASHASGLPYALPNYIEQNVADNRSDRTKWTTPKRSALFK